MSEYTPTPNEIRADFITLHTRNFDSYTVGRSLTSEQEVYGDAFDRMIAEVGRAAAARALDLAASDWAANPDTWGDNEKDYRNELRARAAEIREGKLA